MKRGYSGQAPVAIKSAHERCHMPIDVAHHFAPSSATASGQTERWKAAASIRFKQNVSEEHLSLQVVQSRRVHAADLRNWSWHLTNFNFRRVRSEPNLKF